MKPAPPVTMIMGAGYTCIIEPAAKRETDMAERPRIFDDLAGVAGGALSALAGIREEVEAMVRARIDEAIRRLELVRREELDALAELAANARAGQEAAEAKISALEARVAALEARWRRWRRGAVRPGRDRRRGRPRRADKRSVIRHLAAAIAACPPRPPSVAIPPPGRARPACPRAAGHELAMADEITHPTAANDSCGAA